MKIRQQFLGMIVGLAVGAGAVTFLGSPRLSVQAKDDKVTNADYARDARDHLKKAHEDVEHMVSSDSDKKEKGAPDAEEAKKAIDRADKALGRYLGMADGK